MKKLVFIIGMLAAAMASEAANRLTLPYVCNFEQNEDMSAWTLNDQTPNATDQWCIGNATYSEGKQAMYVSYNHGLSARYAHKHNTISAYMSFQFPASTKQQESYDISFDWRNFGDEQTAQLRVCCAPKTQLTTILNKVTENGDPSFTTAEWNRFNTLTVGNTETKVLYNSEGWKTATFKMNVTNLYADKEWVLLFMWINQSPDSASAYRLAGCVDNLQIVNANVRKPENVSATTNCEESALMVTWESSLNEFVMAYKSSKDEQWHRQEGITKEVATLSLDGQWSYAIHNLEEGVYDIKLWSVKTIDDATPARVDTSACVRLRSVVYYCAYNHCIDYLHLDAPGVKCTYGTYENPNAKEGILDFGSEQKASRHTIMYDPDFTDERTNHRLHTVPEGASASVRLGNWDNGAEGESITYDMIVDEDQYVLLLNYAIVLEDPQHGKEHQPYFRLRILDDGGNLIDGTCAMAEYYAGHGDVKWLDELWLEETPTHFETHKMLWKNWSTVGLNLKDHVGENIHIELTTKDCSEGMHFGYAYFTLDCTAGTIQTNNCTGAAYSEATAPEGFDYEWTRDADQSVVSHERTIQVDASDPSTYTCKCMYKENHGCYFKLQTYFRPEYPKASFEYTTEFQNCKSVLMLENTSYIWYEEGGTKQISPDKPKDYQWHITTSSGQKIQASVPNQTINCNPHGDTVFIAMSAYLSSKNCHDDTTATIIIPRITTPDSIFAPRLCVGETIWWENQLYERDTVVIKRFTNRYDCDSILILDFKANRPRIVEQKWNDVLALLNSKYNGGHEFSSYQWYRNGVAIDGQNGSYLYVPEGLKAGDEYYAEAKNQHNEIITTCPIIIQDKTESQPAQTISKRLVQGRLQIQVNENIYNAQGNLITTTH